MELGEKNKTHFAWIMTLIIMKVNLIIEEKSMVWYFSLNEGY